MTHVSEAHFTHHVDRYLRALFGDGTVERQKWLPGTTAYADFWVDLGIVVLAIEVENDADSVRNGVAQAFEYAANDPRAVPVVLVPSGHVEAAQVDALRAYCPIVELNGHAVDPTAGDDDAHGAA